MGYALGIDIGTTFAAAAVHRGGRAEMLTLGHRATLVPAAVAVTADGATLVGDTALRRGRSEPERLARFFKRRLGDSTPLIVAGSPLSAEALTARLLRAVVDTVIERQGEPPHAIALTCPANWGAFKRDRFAEAVRLAELDDVTIVTEPEAAALAYAAEERIAPGAAVAVYDLGGGTFDATVLRREGDRFAVMGPPEGIDHLGGIDVDTAVFEHVRRSLDGTLDEIDDGDAVAMRAVARLRDECVEAKEALSSDTHVSIPVVLPQRATEVRLTRTELEEMIRPTLEDSVAALRRAVAASGGAPHDIDRILLVGGSSRIPLVGQLVASAFGRPIALDAHPKHAVALGAALVAGGTAGPGSGARAIGATDTHAAATVQPDPPAPDAIGTVTPGASPPDVGPAAAVANTRPEDVVTVPAPVERAQGPADAATDPVAAPNPDETAAIAGTADRSGTSAAEVADRAGVIDRPRPDRTGADRPDRGPQVDTPGHGRRRILAVTMLAVTVLVVVLAAVLLEGGGTPSDDVASGDDASTTTTASSTTTTALPAALEPAAPIEVGSNPDGITRATDGRIWVANTGSGDVTALAPDGTLTATFPAVGDDPLATLLVGDTLWVTNRNDGETVRLDPSTGEPRGAALATGPEPEWLSAGAGFVWVASGPGPDDGDGAVHRIDPATGETATLRLPDPEAVVADNAGRVWISYGEDRLGQYTTDLTEVTSVSVGDDPDAVAVGAGAVWVCGRGDGTVTRVDPESHERTRIHVGGAPAGIAVEGDRVWVLDTEGGRLLLVDARTAGLVYGATTAIGTRPLHLVATPDAVWVTLFGERAVRRVDLS